MRSVIVVALGVCALDIAACGGDERPPAVTMVPAPEYEVAPGPAPTVSAAPVAVPAAAPKPSLRTLEQQALTTALEALNEHNAKKFASVYAENCVISVVGLNEVVGRANVESNMDEWFRTFAKIKLGFRRVWLKERTVVLEWVINGTHTGELFGRKMPETPIGHYGLSIVTMNDDGQVVTERRYGDLGVVATQVGATKEKPRAIPPMPETMDVLESKGADDAKAEALAGAYLGAYAKKSESDYEALLTDTVEVDGLLHADAVKGKSESRKAFAQLLKAFPDAKLSPTLLVGVGDTAVIEYALTGSNLGPLGSAPATKKNVTTHAVDVVHVRDGKLDRVWTYQNSSEMMSQLDRFKIDPVVPGKSAK
jgi:steroid delta-isomerase-like uncharacterized protein